MDLDALYDVTPNVIRLVGGYHDGQRVTIGHRDWPFVWRMPGPVTWSCLDALEVDPLAPVLNPTYQHTDSVNDQGERAYRYVGER